MDFLEKFSKDQLKVLQDCREAQKEELEKLQQEECKTVHAVSDVPKRYFRFSSKRYSLYDREL